MKELVSLFTLLLFVTVVYAKEGTEKAEPSQPVQKDSITMISGLPWHSDVDTAYKIAKKEGKQVIIMVGEDYCKWCKKMKERTFADERVKQKLEAYTLVSIKRSDKSSIKYVSGFDGNIPSLFFMKNTMEPLEAVVGYYVADDLLGYIREIEEQ